MGQQLGANNLHRAGLGGEKKNWKQRNKAVMEISGMAWKTLAMTLKKKDCESSKSEDHTEE